MFDVHVATCNKKAVNELLSYIKEQDLHGKVKITSKIADASDSDDENYYKCYDLYFEMKEWDEREVINRKSSRLGICSGVGTAFWDVRFPSKKTMLKQYNDAVKKFGAV